MNWGVVSLFVGGRGRAGGERVMVVLGGRLALSGGEMGRMAVSMSGLGVVMLDVGGGGGGGELREKGFGSVIVIVGDEKSSSKSRW